MTQPDSSRAETAHGPIYEALKKLSQGRHDDYYRNLGRIASNFSRIDLGTTYILKLLGAPIDRAIANRPLAYRLKELRKTASSALTDNGNRTELEKIVDKIDSARRKRNQLIHSIWYVFGRETGVRYDQKNGTKCLVPLGELIEFDTALEKLLWDLLDLEQSINRNRLIPPAHEEKADLPLP